MDSIVGGRIATDGVVKLSIDSDKVGYIFLPNHTVLTTVAGEIDTPYTGVGGRITYYVPKDSAIVIAVTSILSGDIVWNGDAFEQFYVGFSSGLTGVTALNQETGLINTSTCASLTNLIVPKAISIIATACALTAKAIGDILYAAYVDNRANVNFDFSGGTNANDTAVGYYLDATYGISLFVLLEALTGIGGSGGIIYLNATPPPIP